MATEAEVNVAVAEFKKLVPYYFGNERDYDVMRKILAAAERERAAAAEMRST